MKYNSNADRVIGCAIAVHRVLGPGLLEATYQQCLAKEFELQGIAFKSEFPLPVYYKGASIDCGYRIDFLVENEVIIELKSVDELHPVHSAQLLTYMKLAKVKFGFLVNFNVELLKDGIKSFII